MAIDSTDSVMKVIKSGNTLFNVTCDYCGAELECYESDIYPVIWPDWFEFPHVTCPECDRSTNIARPKHSAKKKLQETVGLAILVIAMLAVAGIGIGMLLKYHNQTYQAQGKPL